MISLLWLIHQWRSNAASIAFRSDQFGPENSQDAVANAEKGEELRLHFHRIDVNHTPKFKKQHEIL